MSTLGNKTVGALIWNLLDRLGQQVLSFIVAIVVANILSVEDYALTGMLVIFTAVANLIIDSGFSAALIQSKDVEQEDLSSVFWLNLILSILSYVLLVLSCPLIAGFFNQPRLLEIAPVVFLSIPLNALSLVQNVTLQRRIDFKPLAKADVLASLLSGLISITLAILGMGVWALVLQAVSLSLIRTLALWKMNPWRPQMILDLRRIRSLFGFASNLLLAGLMNTCFLNVMSLLLGKLYQVRQIGYYTQAMKISDPAITLVYSTIQNATFPALSQIQDEKERLLGASRKTIRLSAMVAFPVMLGLLVTAKPLVELLLKEDWWPAIPYLRWLCVGGCFTILTAINNNFIKVSGKTRGVLMIEIWKILLLVLGILLCYRHGALALVMGFALVRLAVYLVNLHYTGRFAGYGMRMQLLDILPFLLMALLMAGVISLFEPLFTSPLPLLLSQIALGMLIYILGMRLVARDLFKEALGIVRNLRKK